MVSSCVTAEVQMKPEPQMQDKQMLQLHSCPEITRDSATTVAMQPLNVRELGFIEKGTGKHQSNTVYGSDELSPTITAVSWKEPLKVIECQKIEIIGCMDNKTDNTFESANRIYGVGGLSPTIPTCAGGGYNLKSWKFRR